MKLRGDFVWHDHPETDEAFIVIEGDLRIDFRVGAVHLVTGEMFIVPKGVQHKTMLLEGARAMSITTTDGGGRERAWPRKGGAKLGTSVVTNHDERPPALGIT